MKKIFLIMLIFLFMPVVNAKENMEATLFSCIDGDTAKFKTDEGIQSVRFLAIDTPEYTKEKEPYGKEASEFTCNMLKNAKKITLEFDRNSDLYDKYHRLLAWVWVDNELLQVNIIKTGLGEVAYLYDNYKYTIDLESFQKNAQAQKLNIWSEEEDNSWIILLGVIIIIIYYLYKKKKINYKKIIKYLTKK